MPWRSVRLVTALLTAGTLLCGALAVAAEDKAKHSAVVDQVGATVKKLADKLGKEVTGVVKKFEESETPKKVGRELKRSAESLGEKAEQAGKKLHESVTSK